ncbi:MAG TPA: hypothetical protein VIF86_02065 [Methylobacter sp.]
MRKFILKPGKFFSILWLLSIANTAHAQPPEITEANNVQNCRFLERIEGSSGYGKNANWNAMAKYAALSQAEKLGASHIVWERFDTIGGFNGVAIANAYQCKS